MWLLKLNKISIANEFNGYYVNVGSNLANAIPIINEPLIVDDAKYISNTSFELTPITENELNKYVSELRIDCAPGLDNISSKLIKTNFNYLKSPILHIINQSILQGKFPDIYKIGKVVPVYKSGAKNHIINYRPITLLSNISKILEKCIKNQLFKYLIDNNLLFANQFGFRSDKSINDNLFMITKHIQESLNENKKNLLLFIDLAKAFDTVHRYKLLKKMEYLGIKGISLDWFTSYLTNRTQVVSILGKHSSPKPIEYGVVQGSTLGPLLFLIYINNICRLDVFGGELFLYADDTAVLFKGNNWEHINNLAERGLKNLKLWFDQNILTMNTDKTKFMNISLSPQYDPIDIKLTLHYCGNQHICNGCKNIEHVTKFKYLGIMFDNRLRWNIHINYINNKLRKFIYIFSVLNKVLDVNLIKMVYYAYVQSILQYGIIAWGGALKSVIQPLEITQKCIMKTALRKDIRYSTDLLFDEFRVFNLTQLYIRVLTMFIFKNKNQIFTKIEHGHNTRNFKMMGINMPQMHKSINSTNSFYNMHYLYCKLPPELKITNNIKPQPFKNKINLWLSQLDRDTVNDYITSSYCGPK
uniref:Reverse transcriptase domain-containing protein n=1 Tax=Cuerna arida TaxID=1464854 RepID=A0A1B6FP21_9HEMI